MRWVRHLAHTGETEMHTQLQSKNMKGQGLLLDISIIFQSLYTITVNWYTLYERSRVEILSLFCLNAPSHSRCCRYVGYVAVTAEKCVVTKQQKGTYGSVSTATSIFCYESVTPPPPAAFKNQLEKFHNFVQNFHITKTFLFRAFYCSCLLFVRVPFLYFKLFLYLYTKVKL
jgi:hypothetical protein